MLMLKNCCRMIAVSCAAMFLFPVAGQAAILIKVGHGLTEFSAMHAGWVKFKETLEARSGGGFVVEIYPNQQMGGDRELIEGAQLGNVTMTSPTSAPVASFEKDFFILDGPFMFADRAEVYAALDGRMGQFLYDKIAAINLIGLAYWENGFRNLTNSRNAVRKAEDVRGLKLRTMENAIHMAAWKALGANPTPMAFGELFTALQQKTVDGQENPFGQIFDNKFYEVQPYITKTQHMFQPFTVIANKDFWDELSPENREVVLLAMKEATDHQRKEAERLDDEAAAKIKEAGGEILELTPEGLDSFRKSVGSVSDTIKARVSPEAFAVYQSYMKR
jgi:tripartite ATP-independent transporter DctP family solute receptor